MTANLLVNDPEEENMNPFSASELNKLDEDMSWYDNPELPSWVYDDDCL